MTHRNNTPAVLDAAILRIRAKAGNPCTRCPVCGLDAQAPYRSLDAQGRVVHGCVDASHGPHLYGSSLQWHMRPVAVALRRQELNTLRAF